MVEIFIGICKVIFRYLGIFSAQKIFSGTGYRTGFEAQEQGLFQEQNRVQK